MFSLSPKAMEHAQPEHGELPKVLPTSNPAPYFVYLLALHLLPPMCKLMVPHDGLRKETTKSEQNLKTSIHFSFDLRKLNTVVGNKWINPPSYFCIDK
jgi:hypothetical protein